MHHCSPNAALFGFVALALGSSVNSCSCEGTVPSPSAARCGDGTLQGERERCDDGPANGSYGHCAADCQGPGPACGDGAIDGPAELCDDGQRNGSYGACGSDCQSRAAHCGDGRLDDPVEACDDGASNGGYGSCTLDCLGPGARCGDGSVQPGHEQCDDGQANGGYGACRVDCQGPGLRCGDDILYAQFEQCDDGEHNGSYGHCAADCSGAGSRCGDGVTDIGHEQCDDGPANGSYGACLGDCSGPGPRCGDGVLFAARELCDDGPANGELGHCSSRCDGPQPPWVASPQSVDNAWLHDPPACGAERWFAKYLWYRLRLRGNGSRQFPGFVSVGPEPGQSIPPSVRDPGVLCHQDWFVTSGQCLLDQPADAQGMLQWGDATAWLGQYIAVLATEVAMFRRVGLDDSESLSDLAYALAAFDKVDETAETHYGVTPARDGFFQRDDVPADFYLTPDGSRRYPHPDAAREGYDCLTSSDACRGGRSLADGYFVSQDQVVHLLTGMALVKHLIPDDVVVRGRPLRQQAREATHRMVNHLRQNGWRVTDPNGDHPPDQWGGNALGLSDQLALAANWISAPDSGIADYRDSLSSSVGIPSFVGLETSWSVQQHFNQTMAFTLVAITDHWRPDLIASRANGTAKLHFPLLHSLLRGHQVDASLAPWRIESLLSSAPCSGPCHGVAGCAEANGWQGENRVTNPGERFGNKHRPVGEYNGLDYMLLHNLFFLTSDGARHQELLAAPECPGYQGLQAILQSGPASGASYDPYLPCAALDMPRLFCGRPWAAWLQDAYAGRVTIHTGRGRWSCSGTAPCTISLVSSPGTAGNDLLLGTEGDDDLDGKGGDDCLVGLGGNDRLQGGQGLDELHGGAGNDQLYGEGAGLVLDGAPDVLWGGEGNDYLEGGPGDDEMDGGPGDDELHGGAGDDFLRGGPHNDVLYSDGGDDTLFGGDGDDTLYGDAGDDDLYGEAGRDRLSGGSGVDWLRDGEGGDFLRGDDGADRLFATSGLDRLCGGADDDELWGNWDGDTCHPGGGNDQVNGCDLVDESLCSDAAFASW